MPRVIAWQTWQLSLPGCSSLKEKRSVVRSLKDRLRARFPLSVAETAHQDILTRAEVSVALAASDRVMAESLLDQADRYVQETARAVVLDTCRDFH